MDSSAPLVRNSFESGGSQPLAPVELEVIQIFVQIAQVLGLPKSVGEIYGLLFCAMEPLNFDEIMRRLTISKGSTGQGRQLGIIGNF